MLSFILALCVLAGITTATHTVEESSCIIYEDYSIWDLRPIQRVREDSTVNYFVSGLLTYNLCSYINFANTAQADLALEQQIADQTFAYLTMNSTIIPLTKGAIAYHNKEQLDDQKNLVGIRYDYKSSHKCVYDESRVFEFSNVVMCNKNLTETGSPKIISVENVESCNPIVTMEHNAGCPTFSLYGFMKFLDQTKVLTGCILIVLGVALLLIGYAIIHHMGAVIGGTVSGFAVMFFATIFGFISSTVTIILFILIALAAGILIWYLLRTESGKTFQVCVVFGFAGIYMGLLFYSLLLAVFGFELAWLMIVLIIIGGVGGVLLGWTYEQKLVMFFACFLGGYTFMRGWTFIFGHYPSEMQMYQMIMKGQDVDLGWQYFVYLAVAIISAVGGYYFQSHFHQLEKKIEDFAKADKTTT